jgi:hypothetical protein
MSPPLRNSIFLAFHGLLPGHRHVHRWAEGRRAGLTGVDMTGEQRA